MGAWFGMLCQVTCPIFQSWKESREQHCHHNATAEQVWEVKVLLQTLKTAPSCEQGLEVAPWQNQGKMSPKHLLPVSPALLRQAGHGFGQGQSGPPELEERWGDQVCPWLI